MSPWLWALVLVMAIVAAHWGAEQLAEPLKKLRHQWGISAAAGGSFVGIAAASPEIGINIASAVRGVGDIGLGASLGSNVLAIPLIVTVAYVASRRTPLSSADPAEAEGGDSANGRGRSDSTSGGGSEGKDRETHRRHVRDRLLRVGREAVRVQALPYPAIRGADTAGRLAGAATHRRNRSGRRILRLPRAGATSRSQRIGGGGVGPARDRARRRGCAGARGRPTSPSDRRRTSSAPSGFERWSVACS